MFANLRSALRLLYPGLGLKRWLVPLLIGLALFGVGFALFLYDLYATTSLPSSLQWALFENVSPWIRDVLLIVLGAGIAGYSLFQLNKVALGAFIPAQATVRDVAKQVYRHRHRRGGPRVVAIGGGTGLSMLLRGLKHHTDNITAIVTVADDGGSSGKLRRELGVLPPGDFRNCIAALADDEALTTQLFQYRFRSGGLEGHSFGNLFITAMAEVTGSFEQALYESGRVLNIGGTILPSTLADVTLFAEVDEGQQTRKVAGESAIPEAKAPIERVYFQPDAPPAFPPAIQAILNADLILAGPGSLYTSIIPNLLVSELVTAIRSSTAPKIYICNVATQPGETDGYSVDNHMQAIRDHTSMANNITIEYFDNPAQPFAEPYLFSHVLVNNNQSYPIPVSMSHLHSIVPSNSTTSVRGYQVIAADVIDEQYPWRHDSIKLANALMHWYKQSKY